MAYGEVTVYDAAWANQGLQTSSAVGNTGLFAGMDIDPLTGLLRQCPLVQFHEWRFFGRDPIGYKGGIDLYEYVGDDPLTRTDPQGLWLTGDTVPGIPFGQGVNINPPLPTPQYPGPFVCGNGSRKVVVGHVDESMGWYDLAVKFETAPGYYDGFTGHTMYVYQGTFILQRELRHKYSEVRFLNV